MMVSVLVRGIGLLMGVSLLLMVGVLGRLREEASEAYWMVTGTEIGTFPDSYARVDISFPDGTPLRDVYQFTNSINQQTKRIAGWSPDGRWVIYAEPTENGKTRLIRENLGGRQSDVLVSDVCTLHQGFSPMISADQRWMAACETTTRNNRVQEDLLLFTADGRDKKRLNPDPHNDVEDVHWSPDGKCVYYNATDGDGGGFYQVNLENGQHRQLYDGYIDPTFSPDGLWMVFQEVVGNNVFVFNYLNFESGGVAELFRTDRPSRIQAWLPSDVILLYQQGSSRDETSPLLAMFDLETNALTIIAEGVYGTPSITPDRRAVHYIVREEQSYSLYRLDLETLSMQKRYESSERFELVYAPNRPWLLVFEGDIRGTHDLLIYDLTEGGDSLGEPIVGFPLWTLESTLVYPPSTEWVIAEHTSTFAMINVYDGSYSILANRWVVGFSPLIDMEWSREAVSGIGMGMMLGAIGMMGKRVRRMV
jgi:hypothetical protein